jgi:hypothetical protein
MLGHRAKIGFLLGLYGMTFGLQSCGREEVALSAKSGIVWEQVEVPKVVVAGSVVNLTFILDPWDGGTLVVESPLGPQLVRPESDGKHSVFTLPAYFSNHAGTLKWKLVSTQKQLDEGSIEISPDTSRLTSIESYFGPTKLVAGSGEYAEFAMFPLDPYDNVMPTGTSVSVNSFFKGETEEDIAVIRDGFALHQVYTTTEAGTLRIASGKDRIISKNRELNVVSAPGVDFDLEVVAEHYFADGNSILQLVTTPIVDRHGNRVADGTLVEFVVTDDRQNRIRFFGNTMGGKASANTLHPETPAKWSLQGFLSSGAITPELELNFKPAFKAYGIRRIAGGQVLEIGPVETVIGGLAADGVTVALTLQDSQGVESVRLEKVKDGYCRLDLVALRKEKKSIIQINIGGIALQYNEVD